MPFFSLLLDSDAYIHTYLDTYLAAAFTDNVHIHTFDHHLIRFTQQRYSQSWLTAL